MSRHRLEQVAQPLGLDARPVPLLLVGDRDDRCERAVELGGVALELGGQLRAEAAGARILRDVETQLDAVAREPLAETGGQVAELRHDLLGDLAVGLVALRLETRPEPVDAAPVGRAEPLGERRRPGEADFGVAPGVGVGGEPLELAQELAPGGLAERVAVGAQVAAQPPDGDPEVVQRLGVVAGDQRGARLLGALELGESDASHRLLGGAVEQVVGQLHGRASREISADAARDRRGEEPGEHRGAGCHPRGEVEQRGAPFAQLDQRALAAGEREPGERREIRLVADQRRRAELAVGREPLEERRRLAVGRELVRLDEGRLAGQRGEQDLGGLDAAPGAAGEHELDLGLEPRERLGDPSHALAPLGGERPFEVVAAARRPGDAVLGDRVAEQEQAHGAAKASRCG